MQWAAAAACLVHQGCSHSGVHATRQRTDDVVGGANLKQNRCQDKHKLSRGSRFGAQATGPLASASTCRRQDYREARQAGWSSQDHGKAQLLPTESSPLSTSCCSTPSPDPKHTASPRKRGLTCCRIFSSPSPPPATSLLCPSIQHPAKRQPTNPPAAGSSPEARPPDPNHTSFFQQKAA